jgi:excisionase family DNA binding protein
MQDERSLFLRPSQAAVILNIGRSRIYELLQSGALPAVKLEGRTWRIPRAAITRLVEQAMVNFPANSKSTGE